MKIFAVFSLLTALTVSPTPLNISVWDNPGCSGIGEQFCRTKEMRTPLHQLSCSGLYSDKFGFSDQWIQWNDDVTLCILGSIQGFKLSRNLTNIEQMDFGNLTAPYTGDAIFVQSVWNWNTACRSINTSTCLSLKINSGPSQGIYGTGWGWNGTVWVNRTTNNVIA